MHLFHNRREAAHELARHLLFLKSENPIVLGLANGGVPIAEVIAQALDAPLDILIIERLHAPGRPNQIVGAFDEHGGVSAIRSTARWHDMTWQHMVQPARESYSNLQPRISKFRQILPEIDVRDRTVIVVSQGVLTGAKMLGALASLRDRNARKIVVAAPAGAEKAAWQFHDAADLVIIPHRPSRFDSVADIYREYSQVSDEFVETILQRWVQSRPQHQPIIKTLALRLKNDLGHNLACEIDLPPGATKGSGPYPAVMFAHGRDSDARSPRTLPIARRLAEIGILSVRVDFTGHGKSEGRPEEATEQQMYNDIKTVYNNVIGLAEVDEDRIGLVGSGTGGMIMMNLAAEAPSIRGLVARGPMQGPEYNALRHISVPTILIHTDHDVEFIRAMEKPGPPIDSHHQLLHIPESGRLYNDAISLKMMVGATVDWMDDHVLPLVVPGDEDDEPTAETPTAGAQQPTSGTP